MYLLREGSNIVCPKEETNQITWPQATSFSKLVSLVFYTSPEIERQVRQLKTYYVENWLHVIRLREDLIPKKQKNIGILIYSIIANSLSLYNLNFIICEQNLFILSWPKTCEGLLFGKLWWQIHSTCKNSVLLLHIHFHFQQYNISYIWYLWRDDWHIFLALFKGICPILHIVNNVSYMEADMH